MFLTDDENPAALPAVARTLKTLVDGTVRLAIDVEPVYRETVMRLLGEPGTPIVVARLTQEACQQQLQQENTALYRQEAKALRLSAFFRTPTVWRAIGADSQFLAWLRTQSCAYCQAIPSEQRPTEAAHVRRVAEGAGIAIKPDYCAIPLCHEHHGLQHTQGESALGGKEWFDKKCIDYVTRWAWETLKQQFGFVSWAYIPPAVLREWAISQNVQANLPSEYRHESTT